MTQLQSPNTNGQIQTQRVCPRVSFHIHNMVLAVTFRTMKRSQLFTLRCSKLIDKKDHQNPQQLSPQQRGGQRVLKTSDMSLS